MNNPVQSESDRRGLHPLVSAAAIAVIVMCSVGVAAVLGWLPTPSATPHPEDPALAQAGPEGANLATAQPGASGQPQAPGARPPAAQAQPQAQGRPAPAPAVPAAQACRTCGVVETIRQVQVPVKDNSDHLVGTIAGGVAGGVVGNQFGGGSGKTALTVLGAVGGALAGREVERNIRQQQTVTHYELTVRLNDGSTRQFRSAQPFAFASGDHVRVENNQLLPG